MSIENLSDWTKNQILQTNGAIFNNVYDSQSNINSLVYSGSGGHERIFYPITVKKNVRYKFHFDLYSESDLECGGYDDVYEEYVAVTSTNPIYNSDGLKWLQVINKIQIPLEGSKWNTVTLSWTSSISGTVYLIIDYGYLKDNAEIHVKYKNISIEEEFPWKFVNGEPRITSNPTDPDSSLGNPNWMVRVINFKNTSGNDDSFIATGFIGDMKPSKMLGNSNWMWRINRFINYGNPYTGFMLIPKPIPPPSNWKFSYCNSNKSSFSIETDMRFGIEIINYKFSFSISDEENS